MFHFFQKFSEKSSKKIVKSPLMMKITLTLIRGAYKNYLRIKRGGNSSEGNKSNGGCLILFSPLKLLPLKV